MTLVEFPPGLWSASCLSTGECHFCGKKRYLSQKPIKALVQLFQHFRKLKKQQHFIQTFQKMLLPYSTPEINLACQFFRVRKMSYNLSDMVFVYLNFRWFSLEKCVDLKAEGLWDQLLDDFQPEIVIEDWWVIWPVIKIVICSVCNLPTVIANWAAQSQKLNWRSVKSFLSQQRKFAVMQSLPVLANLSLHFQIVFSWRKKHQGIWSNFWHGWTISSVTQLFSILESVCIVCGWKDRSNLRQNRRFNVHLT